MTRLDLVIRHGEVVTSSGVARADIGIAGEKIVQIGGSMEAEREIDASGKLILPGAIDTHVHLTNPGSMGINWVDDFTSGSAAALAGGVTTKNNMTFLREGETSLDALEREGALAREEAIADVYMHPVLGASGNLDQATIDEIPELLAHGCNSIKYFLLFPHFDAQVSAYLEATRRAGENGLITLIHCEDAPLIADATE